MKMKDRLFVELRAREVDKRIERWIRDAMTPGVDDDPMVREMACVAGFHSGACCPQVRILAAENDG